MSDFSRIQGNVQKMIGLQAPEADIDGYLATEGLSPSQFKSQVQAPAVPSSEVGRQVGLTGRYLAEGLSQPAAMIGDAANSLINLGTGGINKLLGTNLPPLQMPSAMIEGGLKGLNLPQPQGSLENIIATASKSLASVPALGEMAAASKLPSLAPMAMDYGRQATSAIGAGVGSQIPKEMDLPPWAQIAGGLVGGLLGGIRPGAPDPERLQRLQEFDKAGVTPSAGDISQSQPVQLFQKASTKIPFSGTGAKELERIGQVQGKLGEIAGGYGSPSTPQALGEATQQAVQDFRFGKAPAGMSESDILTQPTRNSSISAKADVLYNRIPVPGDSSIPIPDTQDALEAISAKYSNKALSDMFSDPKMAKIKDAIATADNGTLSWSDLRQLRTDVRYLKSKSTLDPSIDDRAINQLNEALTSDMHEGALGAGGPRAQQLVKRADSYYGQAMGRLTDNLKSIFGTNRSEAVYNQITNAMSPNAAKSDIAKLTELKRVSSSDEWGDISSTILSNLGKPTAGAAVSPNAPQFSVGKFVTDYNSISPQAKALLFDTPGSAGLRSALDNLAKVAGNMKATDAMANSSHSGEVGVMGALGAGMMTHPATTVASWGSGVIGSRAMYNPTFVNLMTKTLSVTSPSAAAQTASQITNFAIKNPSYADEAHQLLQTLMPVRAQSEQSK